MRTGRNRRDILKQVVLSRTWLARREMRMKGQVSWSICVVFSLVVAVSSFDFRGIDVPLKGDDGDGAPSEPLKIRVVATSEAPWAAFYCREVVLWRVL